MYDRFTQIMNELFEGSGLAVAVSGGADSMALLHLCQRYAQSKKIPLHALTVDHRLRPQSADEAKTVAEWCKQNNIAHRTLVWEGPKPANGLQDAARNARRALLLAACRDLKGDTLALAHQADDQAETLIMRLQRGTGLRGLVGMHPTSASEDEDITLLRPLLPFRRQALRDYCTEHKLPFCDDPSNDDTQFERVRVRQALQALPDLATGVTLTIDRLRDADETLDLLAGEWLEENIEPIDATTLWLPGDFLEDLYPPIQLRVLEGALLEVLPETIEPHAIPLDGLERLLEAMTKRDFRGQTLADVQIKPHTADGVHGFLFGPAPQRRS